MVSTTLRRTQTPLETMEWGVPRSLPEAQARARDVDAASRPKRLTPLAARTSGSAGGKQFRRAAGQAAPAGHPGQGYATSTAKN